ncbi:MAG: SurA N-terminal domain-containing protein, partial [Pseudomonadota bacterium]
MLYDIRERFIGTTGKIVLAVILLLLAFTGFNYTITPKSYVAKVGGEEISLRRVQNAYRAQLERFGDQELPPVLLNQLQAIAVEQVITETALLQYLDEQGFAISDQQIADSITGLEVFQTDGQFDQELYRRLLAQNVMTPATFERDQRAQLMLSQFQATIATSSFFTPAEFRRLIELSNEQREVEWATVSADAFIDDVV